MLFLVAMVMLTFVVLVTALRYVYNQWRVTEDKLSQALELNEVYILIIKQNGKEETSIKEGKEAKEEGRSDCENT